MTPIRIAILVLAAVAAIGLAVLVRSMTASPPTPVTAARGPEAPPVELVKVLTAKVDIPIGKALTVEHVVWQDWPKASVNPAFITDVSMTAPPAGNAGKAIQVAAEMAGAIAGTNNLAGLAGAIVREPIAAGEPILARKVVKAGQGGYLSVVLGPGMRAMSVSVSVDRAVGGFVLPGDRVDIQMTTVDRAPASNESGAVMTAESLIKTRTVLQNVRVLAIDQATEPPKDAKALVGAVVTLEVPQHSVDALARALAQAKDAGVLTLALRSYADTGAAVGAIEPVTRPDPQMVRIYRPRRDQQDDGQGGAPGSQEEVE